MERTGQVAVYVWEMIIASFGHECTWKGLSCSRHVGVGAGSAATAASALLHRRHGR